MNLTFKADKLMLVKPMPSGLKSRSHFAVPNRTLRTLSRLILETEFRDGMIGTMYM